MNPHRSFPRSSRLSLLSLTLGALFVSACQSSNSSQKDAAAPAPEPAATQPADTEVGAPASEGAKPGAAGPPPVSPSQDEKRKARGQSEAEESAFAEEEPAGGPGDDLLERDKATATIEVRLAAEQDAFDVALEPTELSCSGARPHRDAICTLAERLCQKQSAAVLNPGDPCKAAQEKCESVRKRYRDACGE